MSVCDSQVTGWGGMYRTVQWLRLGNSPAWNYECAFWNSHNRMETVQLRKVCFLGVLDSVKCLPTEFLTNFIKIFSVIIFVRKIVKSDCYLHYVCPLGMSQLPLGVFSWFFFGKSVRKFHILLKLDKKQGYFTWSPIYIFDRISLSSS